ncbi:MAG: bifunctional glutamate N-acetyltransferase/amino-acid acetyltransferase ArgJ [Bacillota bacterium]
MGKRCPYMYEGASFIKIEKPSITGVRGFQAAGVYCGLKKSGRDMALLFSEQAAVAAGVYTRNLVQAAPVHLCRAHMSNPIRAIVVNSGNANACTGEQGLESAREMAALTAAELAIRPEEVLVCSTGVIGEQLPMEKVRAGISRAAAALSGEPAAGREAAEAILTTDTRAKLAAYRGCLPAGEFTLAGMAKGAGMICPNMATMLAFIVTDVKISRALLQRVFEQAVESSFNLITVDGDTSTNDTALILANGAHSGVEIGEYSPALELFAGLLDRVCRELAYQIVSDGEGITKVIALTVQGAPNKAAARTLARAVLNSPLVKTAFYGEDANWGRIIAALGYAGIDFDPSRVDISIGPVPVASGGGAVPFRKDAVKAVLKQREVPVLVNLNDGGAAVTAWGTDLTHEYISINSNYRT